MEKGANILVVKIRSLVLIAAGGLVPTPATHAQPVLKKSGVTVGARSEKRLEDIIIVTARRRQESLQVAPVSVVALSGKDLEARSVTNLRSLQNFVPNLTFAPSQNVGEAGANVFIRGIGQEDLRRWRLSPTRLWFAHEPDRRRTD